ncbi:DNA-binding MarR family transcriptional regulator [Saonia flava]|uniref:DNA-binding MarR family transcriptional regulator n=1 Tax=Saonia flava TaxID=523696 RepID=A0A846QRZ7_9FLAO|nr:MarR family winged helix-turn-helix transcriptional regulator [Saonia flava]NJB70848.1 DNA-binding MarR family transcriptional regulator [Saonia flava]
MEDKFLHFLELGIGSRLKRLSGYIARETQIVYDEMKVDFDPYLFPIFKTIIDNQETTTSYIQEALRYTQPAITQAIGKLSKLGYVSSKIDQNDGRKKLLYITKKGEEVNMLLKPIWKVINEEAKTLTQVSANSLVDMLYEIELKLEAKSLSKRILSKLKNH